MKKVLGIAVLALGLLPVSGFAAVGELEITPARVDVEVGVGPGSRPIRRYYYQCYAQNRRGQVFSARGSNARLVQRRAMNICFNYSYECRPLGCDRVR